MTVAEKIKAKVAKETGTIIPAIDKFEMLADPEMMDKIQLKRDLDVAKAWIEKRLKEIGPEIETALMAEDVDGVMWDGCLVKIGKGRTGDKVSTTRLVELGVAIDIIAAATEEGKPYTFAQIVRPKGSPLPTTWEEVQALIPGDWQGE